MSRFKVSPDDWKMVVVDGDVLRITQFDGSVIEVAIDDLPAWMAHQIRSTQDVLVGISTGRGASSPTTSRTSTPGVGAPQAPEAVPVTAPNGGTVTGMSRSSRTNWSRLRTYSSCSGVGCELRSSNEWFPVQRNTSLLPLEWEPPSLALMAYCFAVAALFEDLSSVFATVMVCFPLFWSVVRTPLARVLRKRKSVQAPAQMTPSACIQSGTDPSNCCTVSSSVGGDASDGASVVGSDPTEGDAGPNRGEDAASTENEAE